jgi:hypothetical protein
MKKLFIIPVFLEVAGVLKLYSYRFKKFRKTPDAVGYSDFDLFSKSNLFMHFGQGLRSEKLKYCVFFLISEFALRFLIFI